MLFLSIRRWSSDRSLCATSAWSLLNRRRLIGSFEEGKMQNNNTTGESTGADEKVGTVAGAVLATFFDAVATTSDLADIAANLRKILLEDGVFAEPAVRADLFPAAPYSATSSSKSRKLGAFAT